MALPARLVQGTAILAVLLVSSCASRGSDRPAGRTSSPVASPIAGASWLLTQVRSSTQTVVVPPSYRATCQFTDDGQFLASDTVNAISGRYELKGTSLRLTNVATTLVGYAGKDPVRLAVISAMAAMTLPDAAIDVSAGVGGSLVLSVGTHVLMFTQAGPATTFAAPSPTPSTTR